MKSYTKNISRQFIHSHLSKAESYTRTSSKMCMDLFYNNGGNLNHSKAKGIEVLEYRPKIFQN